MPPVLRIDPQAPDPGALARAAEVLRGGGLVAFPTETVYGLGALALDAAAIGRIFEAKGRPAINPLIVHVADVAGAEAVAHWTDEASRVAERFWPGPLTLVLPRREVVPQVVTAGLDTVAVRCPDHAVARGLIAAVGAPLAAPSANRSGSVSPTRAEHVVESLGDRIDLVLDAGPTEVGIESTVVGLGPPRLLRLGQLGRPALEEVLGPLGDAQGERPESPGQLLRHYAPRAALRVTADLTPGPEVGLLVHRASVDHDTVVQLPADPAGYGRGLYAALHELDARCQVILVEPVPEDEAWAAIRDRLERAARGR